jgi:hypothetical protein
MRIRITGGMVLMLVAAIPATTVAQQKGQYILGTYGLNAGIQPAPGFSYGNQATFFWAGRLKGGNGQPIPVNGSYDLDLDQNMFIYTSTLKILGGTYGAVFDLVTANASVTAPQIGLATGGEGVSDTYIQPLTLGYHYPRVDFSVNFGLIAPTGRYSPNPNSDTNGSGYWGYMPSVGSTIYLTRNKGTSLSVFSLYEFHGKKRYSNITPGQTFNLEWGLGQMLPVKSNLLQFGVVGYGQWQTSDDGGRQSQAVANSRYAVAAIGPQATYIVPKWNLSFFFRYEPEFGASLRVEGTTLTFGGAISSPVTK